MPAMPSTPLGSESVPYIVSAQMVCPLDEVRTGKMRSRESIA